MNKLNSFATILEWVEESGKQFPGRWGPDIIAIDKRHAAVLVRMLHYDIVDIQLKVGEVDASDLIGTPLMPDIFDPLLN